MLSKKLSYLFFALIFMLSSAKAEEGCPIKFFVEENINCKALKNFIIDWENRKEQTPKIFHKIFDPVYKKYINSEKQENFLDESITDVALQIMQEVQKINDHKKNRVIPTPLNTTTQLFSPLVKTAVIILCVAIAIKLITSALKDIKSIKKDEKYDFNEIKKDISEKTKSSIKNLKNSVANLVKKSEEKPKDTEKPAKEIYTENEKKLSEELKNLSKELKRLSKRHKQLINFLESRNKNESESTFPKEKLLYSKKYITIENNSEDIEKTFDNLAERLTNEES